MAEFSLKLKAAELGKDLEDIGDAVVAQLEQALQDLAHTAHAVIIAKAQADLSETRQDYLKGLKFETLGKNSYLISLEEEFPISLEEGFQSFDMKPGMLKSAKVVELGTRAGSPWVQQGKDGSRYAHVPFKHTPFSQAGKTDLNAAIREMTAFNASGRKQKLTSIFKSPEGKPLSGEVARVRSNIPEIDGITKFQKVLENADTGKLSTSSIYLTWRTISDNGGPWIHKGYKGLKAFLEAEDYVEDQLEEIIRTLL